MSLLAMPLQDNFCGSIYNTNVKRESNVKTLIDVAAFVSTHALDLSLLDADYVCMSMYKIFGLPTSVGVLVNKKIKNENKKLLKFLFILFNFRLQKILQ